MWLRRILWTDEGFQNVQPGQWELPRLDHLGFALLNANAARVTGMEGIQTVAVGRCAPGQHAPSTKSRQPAAAHAVGDHRPLVLSHGAADLNDQRVLRVASGRSFQEHDRAARMLELFQQPHLVGVATGESVRAGDQDRVHVSSRHGVAQAVEGGPIESGAAVSIILMDALVGQARGEHVLLGPRKELKTLLRARRSGEVLVREVVSGGAPAACDNEAVHARFRLFPVWLGGLFWIGPASGRG